MATRSAKHSKKDIKEKVQDGWLHVSVLYEMVGSPKAHIEKTFNTFLDNINADEQVITISEDFEDIIEVDDSNGLFSVAAEVEYLVLGLEKLTWLAFNFMPASIEIKAPGELTFKDKDFSNWMNDLLAKLHEINTNYTQLKSEHGALIKNLNAAIRNNILLAMDIVGNKTEDIAKKVGMKADVVEKFMHAMGKEGQLVLGKDGFKKK